jgi:hypothetical protein
MTDQSVHRRFLEYRDLFVYFGHMRTQLNIKDFTPLDAELAALLGKPKKELDDEDHRRIEDLRDVLLRD